MGLRYVFLSPVIFIFKCNFFKTKCIAGFAHIKKVTYLITVKDV